jgi:hypothetical protein
MYFAAQIGEDCAKEMGLALPSRAAHPSRGLRISKIVSVFSKKFSETQSCEDAPGGGLWNVMN